jgi:hypothetical protein
MSRPLRSSVLIVHPAGADSRWIPIRARLSAGETHQAGDVRHWHQVHMQIDSEAFLADLE